MRIINDMSLKIAGQTFESDCNLQLDVITSKQELLLGKLKLLQDMKHAITVNVK